MTKTSEGEAQQREDEGTSADTSVATETQTCQSKVHAGSHNPVSARRPTPRAGRGCTRRSWHLNDVRTCFTPRAGFEQRGQRGPPPSPGCGATAGSGHLPISCRRWECWVLSRAGGPALVVTWEVPDPPPGPGSTGMPLAPLARARDRRPAGKEHGCGPHARGLRWERTPDEVPGSPELRPLTNTPWASWHIQLSSLLKPSSRHFQPTWAGSWPRSHHPLASMHVTGPLPAPGPPSFTPCRPQPSAPFPPLVPPGHTHFTSSFAPKMLDTATKNVGINHPPSSSTRPRVSTAFPGPLYIPSHTLL